MNSIVFSLVSLLISLPTPQKKVEKTQPLKKVEYWLTKQDRSALLSKQHAELNFQYKGSSAAVIEVSEEKKSQDIEGFGYALTGGSAQVMNSLQPLVKKQLLNELFSNQESGIGISYLRISLGASDLDSAVFSYNDLPQGSTDLKLEKFSLNPDKTNLIPILKEILLINPRIKIMACPWSPPAWMKNNNSTKGGSLQTKYYDVYARYFVKYIQQMKANGITIDAITPQNEPLHPGNNPSLLFLADEETNFIKNNLGPAFQSAKIKTKIIVYDHNCNKPEYPISILNDASAKKYIAGSAFHLYEGDISALSTVHAAHPDKGLYFTEQWTSSEGDFGGDLKWHVKNVLIGSMQNWSKVALEWNLANDASFGPHTLGGCNQCKGAITVLDPSSYTKNVSYYIIAHASKFVPVGSIKIGSNLVGNLNNVAFKTPAGKIVLIVENDGSSAEKFCIQYKGKFVTTSIDAGSVATYIW